MVKNVTQANSAQSWILQAYGILLPQLHRNCAHMFPPLRQLALNSPLLLWAFFDGLPCISGRCQLFWGILGAFQISHFAEC